MADEMSKNEKDVVEKSIESLSSMRRGKLGVCTRRMNEVKALLAEGCDVESIKRSAGIFFELFQR